jgi:hypothetical protein
MSADPAVLEYAEPKRPLAIPSQPTEEDNARLPRRAVDFGWRFHASQFDCFRTLPCRCFPKKDRREIRAQAESSDAEMHAWYDRARNEPCT